MKRSYTKVKEFIETIQERESKGETNHELVHLPVRRS